jgi:hypothetical protein
VKFFKDRYCESVIKRKICFMYLLWNRGVTVIPVICRNEFYDLGKELDSAKDRDMERYYDILVQLKESYHQCGMVCFILVSV